MFMPSFKWLLLFTHREVFKAKHRQTGKKVALKKVLMENEKEGVSYLKEQVVLIGFIPWG